MAFIQMVNWWIWKIAIMIMNKKCCNPVVFMGTFRLLIYFLVVIVDLFKKGKNNQLFF